MKNTLNLFQYTCPQCGYILYSENDTEELFCKGMSCSFKESLHIKNLLEVEIKNDSQFLIVKESFMVDHGCHEVRPITKGTKVELIKIKKGWYLVETLDGFSFFAPKERFTQPE